MLRFRLFLSLGNVCEDMIKWLHLCNLLCNRATQIAFFLVACAWLYFDNENIMVQVAVLQPYIAIQVSIQAICI